MGKMSVTNAHIMNMIEETCLILTSAQIAAQRWMKVTAIAIWHEQEQMMDIGDMVTIFVAMGESRGKYIENWKNLGDAKQMDVQN